MSVRSEDFFHGGSAAAGSAGERAERLHPQPGVNTSLMGGDSASVSEEPGSYQHPREGTTPVGDGGEASSKSWKIDLRDVSSRLNVSLDHLVEGLRASVHDKSPVRMATDDPTGVSVENHLLDPRNTSGQGPSHTDANTTISASGSFPYSPDVPQTRIPVPVPVSPNVATSKASSILSVSPNRQGGGLVMQLQVDPRSNRLVRASASPRSSISRTPTMSPSRAGLTQAEREQGFLIYDEQHAAPHARVGGECSRAGETPPRGQGSVFAPHATSQAPRSTRVAVPPSSSPRLSVSLSVTSGGCLSGTALSIERIQRNEYMHAPHPPSVMLGHRDRASPLPHNLTASLSSDIDEHDLHGGNLSDNGTDYDGCIRDIRQREREPLLHHQPPTHPSPSLAVSTVDVASRQGSLGPADDIERTSARQNSDQYLKPPEKQKKNVGFLNVGGSPISQVHIYEAIDQEAIVLDVEYHRPRWVWVGLLFINACLAYSATLMQTVEEDSSLPNDQAAAVLAFWTSMGQAVLLVIVLPFLFFPTKSDKEFMSSWSGVLLLVGLSVVMTAERIFAQIALDYTKDDEDGGKVPAYIAITQFPLMLLLGRACLGKQTILVEVIAAVVGCVGMGLMMSNSLSSYGVKHASRLVGGLALGLTASIFGALEIVLVHKLRNSMPLVFLLSASQLLSGVLCFPIAIFWGTSALDIFSEVTTYTSWQFFSIVGVLTLGNALTYHVLSFLHPVTVCLAVNAQAVFVLSFVEDNDALLGAGYLIGATFLLTASGWGSYLSARIRRNISIEVSLR